MAEGLQPTFDINGGNNGGWGNWGGALIGGAIGGAFGAGWGNNRNNGCGCGGGCGCGDSFIMDSLTTMRSDINSIGRDQLLQGASNAATACQGFGGVNASIERVGAAQALAQSRTEAAILTTGYQGQLAAKDNTFQIVSSQKDCCCQTQRLIEAEGCATRQAIHAEGEATRALITQNTIQDLRDKNAELGSALSTAHSREFSVGLARDTQRETLAAVRAMLNDRTTANTPAANG